MGAVTQSVPALVLVHDDVEPPVKTVLDALVRANNLVEAFSGEHGAEQVVCGLGGCGRTHNFPNAGNFSDGGQTGPIMVVLQPTDIGGDHGHAGFDAAVIPLDDGFAHAGPALWIVERRAYVIVQGALVAPQGQGIVAALVDDRAGDLALVVERVRGHDCALQRKHIEQLQHSSNLVGLGIGGGLREHHALLTAPDTDRVQRRLFAGAIERTAQNLAIDCRDTFNLPGKARHEPLKGNTELCWVKLTEQPAERGMAGQAVGQLEKAAQKRLLRLREQCHINSTSVATQHRAQGRQQKFMEVVQSSVAASWILTILSTRRKFIQHSKPLGIFTTSDTRTCAYAHS